MEDRHWPGSVQRAITRRRALLDAAAAAVATALLAACRDGDSTTATTVVPATGTRGSATMTGGPAADTATGNDSSELVTLLGIDPATSGKGKTIELGAVLSLTGTGSYYGKTMSRGLDLAAEHIVELGGPRFKYIYLDHKSGDPAAGVQAMAELVAKGITAKFASYGDDLGAMLAATADNKVFTLDGAAGTGTVAQGKPYFWGTRAIAPTDSMPGVFRWMRDAHPAARTVGVVRWDLGRINNEGTRRAVVAKIAASGYQFNGLYELVPVANQDFSQVIQKVRANEPDILLVSIGDPALGSFSNQAATAGLKAVRIGFDFTPDGVKASKGTYDSVGFTFAYDYFDPKNPRSALARRFVDDFNKTYGEDPDLYAANFYEDAFVMWELVRRIWKVDANAEITGEALETALESNLTVVSVYGGDDAHLGTFTLDPTTHSVVRREMGVFEYKGGKVTPKAFFNIGGADYRTP